MQFKIYWVLTRYFRSFGKEIISVSALCFFCLFAGDRWSSEGGAMDSHLDRLASRIASGEFLGTGPTNLDQLSWNGSGICLL
jgi:hypothetical protein